MVSIAPLWKITSAGFNTLLPEVDVVIVGVNEGGGLSLSPTGVSAADVSACSSVDGPQPGTNKPIRITNPITVFFFDSILELLLIDILIMDYYNFSDTIIYRKLIIEENPLPFMKRALFFCQ